MHNYSDTIDSLHVIIIAEVIVNFDHNVYIKPSAVYTSYYCVMITIIPEKHY